MDDSENAPLDERIIQPEWRWGDTINIPLMRWVDADLTGPPAPRDIIAAAWASSILRAMGEQTEAQRQRAEKRCAELEWLHQQLVADNLPRWLIEMVESNWFSGARLNVTYRTG